MNCPAAPRLEAQFPDTSGPAARLGTAAHGVCERCLKRWQRGDRTYAGAYLGTEIVVEGDTFIVDQDMVDACDVFIEHAKTLIDADELGQAVMGVERKVTLPFIRRGLGGTADLTVEHPLDKLYVRDYKHGTGVRVFAEDNPQTRIYGLGALWDKKAKAFLPVDTVDLGIVQPRILDEDGNPSITSEVLEAEELIAWGEEKLKPACKAAMSKKSKPCAGDWCQFCKANGPTCPAVSDARFALAQSSFTAVAEGETLAPPDPEDLTPEQLRRVWEGAQTLSKWVDNVKAYLFSALSEGRIRYDDIGLKLVEGRANRSFEDAATAIQTMRELGISPYTEPQVRSPAQAEAELKEMHGTSRKGKELLEVDKKVLSKAITVKRGKNIAPIDSKKPAIPQPANFTPVE